MCRKLTINQNTDIENTMIAPVLGAPGKFKKNFIKVYSVFLTFLCASITSTLKRISISGFGAKLIILGFIVMTVNSTAEELRPSQLKSLENIFKKIQQSQEIINEQNPTGNIDKIKARTRELVKI